MAKHSMTLEQRFWNKVQIAGPYECWLWTGSKCLPYGHGDFRIGRKIHKAHRVSWTLTNGPIPDGLCVCHSCDVPGCVNPLHLWLGTQGDNTADRDAKGRHKPFKGEAHPRSKLRDQDIRDIRAISGETHESIAKRYGVAYSLITRIRARQSWTHID